jgi:hypothetical protein
LQVPQHEIFSFISHRNIVPEIEANGKNKVRRCRSPERKE